MPATGVKLTEEERAILAPIAYDKRVEGWSLHKVAEHLNVSRETVRRLVERERMSRRSEHGSSSAEMSIARYEKVIRRAWEELTRRQSNGLAVPALLNAVIHAQSKIDEIEGNKAPLRYDVTKRLEQIDLSKASDEQLDEIERLHERMQEIIRTAVTAEPSES